MAHVQFETIHPFLDGNGRLGRLLITLILCEQRVLREPLWHLSLYFKGHRQQAVIEHTEDPLPNTCRRRILKSPPLMLFS